MKCRISFVLLVALAACGRTPAPGVITRFGSNPSPDGRLMLTVVQRPNSLVAFTLALASDGRALHADTIGSDAQRWCFHWDAQSRLWAYSSDTGYFFVFTVLPDGAVPKTAGEKTTPMPNPVYDFLPESLKRGWGI